MNENKIGLFIAKERKQKNMTQKDLADKLFVTDRAVSKWERGLSYPDILLLEKLSNILEVNVSELLNGERIDNISKDKADNIVKDSISIYKKVETKKNNQKIILTILTTFIIIMMPIIIYSLISIKLSRKIYITPYTYIETEPKESREAKIITDKFMEGLKNKDVETIDKLLKYYLSNTEIKQKDNIKEYKNYLNDFYNIFTIENYKYNNRTYLGIEAHTYLIEYEMNMKYNLTNENITLLVQLWSDGLNIYLNAAGCKDNECISFKNYNPESWEKVKNVFNHLSAINNLSIKKGEYNF